MNIYVLDFELVLKSYQGYHQSLQAINLKKEEFTQKIEAIKSEMERLIKASSSIILDDNTKNLNTQRLKELQQQGMGVEADFRENMGEFQNTELERNFAEVNDLVSNWVVEKNRNPLSISTIDLVLNKNQTIFAQESLDLTNQFLEWLKNKELFQGE